MSINQRNFATYELGDDVLQLGGGVIPELAEFAGVTLDEKRLVDSLGKLVGAYGTSKVLRENELPDELELGQAAAWVEESGILLPLRRPFTRPSEEPECLPRDVVVSGAVANWQDRTATLLVETFGKTPDFPSRHIHIVSGNRQMGTPTEIGGGPLNLPGNPNVRQFVEKHGKAPNEAEYASEFVVPVLEGAGMTTTLSAYSETDGRRIAEAFMESPTGRGILSGHQSKSGELESRGGFMVARVATAGVQLAIQLRDAALTLDGDFDRSKDFPQVYVLTDGAEVAGTEEQVKLPAEYQSPFTALRQLVLTAKLLEEAARQDGLR